MLPGVTLPASPAALPGALRPCFTAPGFATFCGLAAGLAGQVSRRTVAGMLPGAAPGRRRPHDRAHYFFARARRDPDDPGAAVARLAVLLLLPPGQDLRAAVGDPVFRRSGRKVFGAGWQHDGSSPARNKLSCGCCFVAAAVIVHLPFCSREAALPVPARLRLPGRYGNGKANPRRDLGPGTVEIAAALVTRLALAFPGRGVHVVADGAYHGPALRTLPPAVTRACAIPRNAVLCGPAPHRTGRRGCPRTKGDPPGTLGDIAAAARWDTVTAATCRGRRDTVTVTAAGCLRYGSRRARPVRLVPARNPGTAAGYDLALVTTGQHAAPAALITRYAARRATGQAFAGARCVPGAGEARNRTRRAVERTVPFALLLSAITVTWYARSGHDPAAITARRRDQPWYTAKTEPSFEDMLTSLRRVLITARISGGTPAPPTPRQIHAVLTAWEAAAA